MEIFKSFKIGRLYFYVSDRKMFRKSNCTTIINEHRKKLRLMKSHLYKESGGRCQECGEAFDKCDLEIHHIVPTSENPRLVVSLYNLHLVCPSCHAKLHGRPYKGVVTAEPSPSEK